MPSLQSKMALDYDQTNHTLTYFVMYDPGGNNPLGQVKADVTLTAPPAAFTYQNQAIPANPDAEGEDETGIEVTWLRQQLNPGVWKQFEINLGCSQSGVHTVTGRAVEPNRGWSTQKEANIVCP